MLFPVPIASYHRRERRLPLGHQEVRLPTRHHLSITLLLATAGSPTAGCIDVNAVQIDDYEFVDGKVMRDINARKKAPKQGYSDGYDKYGFVSPLMPDIGRPFDSATFPDFHTSPVVWTTPGADLELSWELRASLVSEDLGYPASDPADVGLCLWDESPGAYWLADGETRDPWVAKKEVGGIGVGQRIIIYDKYAKYARTPPPMFVELCDESVDTSPNPFNYPRVYDRDCQQTSLCSTSNLQCNLDCVEPATINASYQVKVIATPEEGFATTHPDVDAFTKLGPTVNVPARRPSQSGTIEINAPVSNDQLTTIIRPLTWSDKENSWTFTVQGEDGDWIENFTMDYAIGAFRVFSVHTMELDSGAGPMEYANHAWPSFDGVRRTQFDVSIDYAFPAGPFGRNRYAIPSSCIDQGAGINSATCPRTGDVTPAFQAGTPEVLTWLVDIPGSHPKERREVADFWELYTCDYRVEPPSLTMTPCWWDGDILMTNQYYIEFLRIGQSDPTPTPEIPPTPGTEPKPGDRD